MGDELVRWARVEIDYSLLQEFFTKGWKPEGVECISGLPKTAKYISMFMSRYRPAINLVFEDESFDLVPRGTDLPWISVTFQKTHKNEPV